MTRLQTAFALVVILLAYGVAGRVDYEVGVAMADEPKPYAPAEPAVEAAESYHQASLDIVPAPLITPQ